MKVLVCGAGVIGRVLAARLSDKGHHVTMYARPDHVERLNSGFAVVRRDGMTTSVKLPVTDTIPDAAFDVAFLTVRRDDIAALLPDVAAVRADRVVLMANCPLGTDRIIEDIGAGRAVLAFPGFGGYLDDAGVVHYAEIAQQPTTVGARGGREISVVALLATTGLKTAVTVDMPAWLATHAVFITAMVAAVLRANGDVTALAASRSETKMLVLAVREGFRALERSGTRVVPRALRTIFTRVPVPFAVAYWRGQLRGELGTVSIAPHARASQDTEFPLLCSDVRALLAAGGPTPTLEALLAG